MDTAALLAGILLAIALGLYTFGPKMRLPASARKPASTISSSARNSFTRTSAT